jgi:serine/threonine-protein kinase HipA
MNPSVDRNELSLANDETESICDISVVMAAYKAYGISSAQADAVLKSVEAAVAGWRTEATRFGISKTEQSLMAAAFE